jgi:hypothetical protein
VCPLANEQGVKVGVKGRHDPLRPPRESEDLGVTRGGQTNLTRVHGVDATLAKALGRGTQEALVEK